MTSTYTLRDRYVTEDGRLMIRATQDRTGAAVPLFHASSPAAQPLVDILNAEREALGNLPPMPRPALFDSPGVRAEKQARAAEIRYQREAIEAETIAKIRALAEQGDMVARGFLAYERMSGDEKEDIAAAYRGRYDGDY